MSLDQILHENIYISAFREITDYISVLYCKFKITHIHLQPFFVSPRKDNGYDIVDHKNIDLKYGTLEDFTIFIKKCKLLNISVIIDLVFNHVSVQHPWFKNAINGDKHYIDYFISTTEKPEIIAKKDNYAIYRKNNNETYSKEIFMNNSSLKFPHWVNYGERWYFHTFYENQIDLNFKNPNLVNELIEIYKFWSKFGINFRFDAIDHFKYGIDNISENINFELIEDFLKKLKTIDPHPKFICEAVNNTKILKSNYVDYIYDFKTCEKIWMSYIFNDSSYILDHFNNIYTNNPELIKKMLVFLRNHDELYFIDSISLLPQIFDKMKNIKNIGQFGFGIAGTTMAFLNQNKYYFEFMYGFLFSLPFNNILIPSGDEHLSVGNSIISDDNREMNRPNITEYYNTEYTNFFSDIKNMKDKYFINFKEIYSYGKIIKILYEKCVIYHNISNETVRGSRFGGKFIMGVGIYKISIENEIYTVEIGPISTLVFSI